MRRAFRRVLGDNPNKSEVIRMKDNKTAKAALVAIRQIDVINSDLNKLDENLDQELILELMYFQGQFEEIRDLLKDEMNK